MTRLLFILALPLASPVLAAKGGALDTLPLGTYACELPGDATGPVGVRSPEHDFTITNASSYASAAGSGTYLLTGDRVAMTSGPQNGTSYRRLSDGFLRRLGPDGSATTLRCIRGPSSNQR